MRSVGSVVAVSGDQATVRVFRGTACEGCHACERREACHAEFLLSDKPRVVETQADNPDGAMIGDRVEIVTDDKLVLLLAFVTFVAPFLLAGAFWMAAGLFLSGEARTVSTVVSFFVFFASLAFAANLTVKKRVRFIARKITQESAD